MLLSPAFADTRKRLLEFCDLAVKGLSRMAMSGMRFPHTMRSIGNRNGSGTKAEGDNLRYTINVAQGLLWTPISTQRRILGGKTAAELALSCISRAARSDDTGAIALAAWAAAETAGVYAKGLLDLLENALRPGASVETVSCAWTLTAALAARHLGDTRELEKLATDRLLASQSDSGLFPHVTPTSAAGWGRSHVGCFADQVYSIQALARLGYVDRDDRAMRASEACAARIVALQGPAGQWWWHYDTRDGSVVEGYPVYSVHQHAMAPMALLDLQEAGGADHRDALAKGLKWIDERPETKEAMVSVEDGVIWRKVGRSEPPKLVRTISAATTAIKTGWHLPGLDVTMPPGKVDRECRPYEFGWMLYAWRSRGVVQQLRANT
ncbi:hypothetical protein WH87_08080 [Devosia epidermidihirudinis]|uniref:Squalene cyclase C-terminal domain-containing protein n=1 Tax=Devosia epidermidihirudinis TaxID=1293439 RepID=A0A0F5QFN4_9HYPH|nr:hypothetical protein [Devosia epidermidihirudinis]KKC38834.1 hypothetical protein WH87_08080 [Devosia epidermidihirudinis]